MHRARPKPPPGPVPQAAIDYLEAKKLKPGFSYLDVWREEHLTAFTVAKVMEKDVLKDVKDSLAAALREGMTFREWAKDIKPTLDKSGWSNYVGDNQKPRRLATIFDANMRTARAVGQWGRITRAERTHPYLQYNLGPSKVHREQHKAWEGLILPVTDSFWRVAMPPNGYGCRCHVRQLTQEEAFSLGGPSQSPDLQLVKWENPKTGASVEVPEGIQPGWDFNPGAISRDDLNSRITDSASAPTKPEEQHTPVVPTEPPVQLPLPIPANIKLGAPVGDEYWSRPTSPTGKFNPKPFGDALARTKLRGNDRLSKEDQITIRRELNNLLAEVGMVSADVRRDLSGAGAMTFGKLPKDWRGVHGWDGAITLHRSLAVLVRQVGLALASRKAGERLAIDTDQMQALRTLIHETVHGHSAILPAVYARDAGRVVEEATTEVAAQRFVEQLTGKKARPNVVREHEKDADATGTYDEEVTLFVNLIAPRLVEADPTLRPAQTTNKATLTAEAYRELGDAAVAMRAVNHTFNSSDDYLVHFLANLPRVGKQIREARDKALAEYDALPPDARRREFVDREDLAGRVAREAAGDLFSNFKGNIVLLEADIKSRKRRRRR